MNIIKILENQDILITKNTKNKTKKNGRRKTWLNVRHESIITQKN